MRPDSIDVWDPATVRIVRTGATTESARGIAQPVTSSGDGPLNSIFVGILLFVAVCIVDSRRLVEDSPRLQHWEHLH